MIKKYEIIMDGSKKRIKALRSFHVQGRYVNLGDVGGIVYDENTLSQEGNCWIFSGNLNYPSIRVSGDSIVDTNGYEADVTDPRPTVNITGTSALIGAHDFVSGEHPVEAYLDINDSRLEFQYTNAMTVATKVNPSNASSTAAGLKSSVSASTLTISKLGGRNGIMWIFADIDHCNVTVSNLTTASIITGTFKNVKRLLLDGTVSWGDPSAAVRATFNFTDCDTVAYTNAVFPTTTITTTVFANTPLIFTRCNVPNGLFYHNAKAKNIYTDIDFAKASVDLGKTLSGTDYLLVSSEVEGMYRIYDTVSKTFKCLVEAYDSVAGLTSVGANSYNTTIYKDAYIGGKFDFAGTNVFGNKVPGHPRARVLNVQPRAVQGDFDTVSKGQTITGADGKATVVCILEAFRISGSKGLLISGAPAGIEVSVVFVSANNTIISASGWTTTPWTPSPVALAYKAAYLRFRKSNDSPIAPEDLAGITVTVYNGCKIVNTGTEALSMKGNIRVEDNASLVNASVTGSGYFGGNSVVYYDPTVWASLDFVGAVFMKDKAVFAPTALTGACALVHMEGNAKFIGSVDVASTNLSFIMRDNAVIEGKANTRSGVVMSGNSKVAAAGQIMAASRGVLVMEGNASIEADTTVIGAITLAGNYKGNVAKTWTGKRTITDVNAPEYDDNVKTEYDF